MKIVPVYISRDAPSLELLHYGVLGMKWGVRKDRYKGTRKRGRSETDKNYRIKRVSEKKTYTQGRLNDIYSDSKRQAYDIAGKSIEEDYERGDISGTKDWDSGGEALKGLQNNLIEENIPKISEEHSLDDDMRSANQLKGVYGYENNCSHCTLATALRGKGYDVVATPMEPGGTNMTEQSMWFDGGKFDSVLRNRQDPEHVEIRDNYLSNALATDPNLTWEAADREVARQWMVHDEPEGSYGFLNGQYDSRYADGGHSIFYEIKDGDVVCRDGQTGERYDSFYDATKYFKLSTVNTMRVDDKQPNWDMINASGAVEVRNDYYDERKK